MPRTMLAIAAAAVMAGCMVFKHPPRDPSAYARTQMSAAQLYRATFTPSESIRFGKLHSWNLQIVAADGAPVDDCTVTVDGGMPQHGHGLPTKPVVTKHLGSGKHVIEGMKFNMGGWWVVRVSIVGAKGNDVVTFNLKL
jgi:hypothetical protein